MPTSQHPFIELSEAEFDAQYSPQTKEDGELFDIEDVKSMSPQRVWTIVEGSESVLCDDGEEREHWYALPGFHHVNRMGYVVSDTPWPHDNIQAMWFEVE